MLIDFRQLPVDNLTVIVDVDPELLDFDQVILDLLENGVFCLLKVSLIIFFPDFT